MIKQRLALLREAQCTGGALPAAPGPQDMHPTAYATVGLPTLFSAAGNGGPAVSSPRPLHHGNGVLGIGAPPGLRGGAGADLPRMSSVERDIHAGNGPQPMEGIEMQRRDRDRDGHRDRDRGGPMQLDDRSRGGPPPQLHRGGNDRGPPSSQQLGSMDLDKPYPGMGIGAGGISGLMPSVCPSSRDNGNDRDCDRDSRGIALHHRSLALEHLPPVVRSLIDCRV